ncbi:EndoS/ChiA family endoglycosidase [Acetivibrio ethanolgignens]|uniref:mannosyl-glycoprotein endo-beta-N-acetylglucosaminidase n=1 Tax=Acetivibrio ethanolgignens TaxID=290052 RepID=A0A0V8QCU0_9FIRM|nr:Ig-like domain-containing protein [Acetivibrio ethanolgignens]KSV58316.1 hypothetical protein ASU35_02610 [Acetivibrio ethanolgignens]
MLATTPCIPFEANAAKVYAEDFVPVESIDFKDQTVKAGETITLPQGDGLTPVTATSKENGIFWEVFYTGETEVEVEKNATAKVQKAYSWYKEVEEKATISSITPKKPGYIYLRAEVAYGRKDKYTDWDRKDASIVKYYKITVTDAAGNAPEQWKYPQVDKAEMAAKFPLKAPLYMGYYRTWMDYWSEACWNDSVHRMTSIPEEVNVAFVFHDYTEDENPYWEYLKNEYVPKLNAQGTRVLRTIGIRDIDGRRGVSAQFPFKEDAAEYKSKEEYYGWLAEKIVDEYVTKHNLDGLDIDMEYHDTTQARDMKEENWNQAEAVFNEIGKLIGKTSTTREKNMIFILDTNMEANSNKIFKNIYQNFDYLLKQVYSYCKGTADGWFSSYYPYYKDNLNAEYNRTMLLPGFSFYENEQFVNVPREDLVVSKENRTKNISSAKTTAELMAEEAFQNCGAYQLASTSAAAGLGGAFGYAVERDGVAAGFTQKWFKNAEGSQDSIYLYSRALKEMMLYKSNRDVTDLELTAEDTFIEGSTLELTARVLPENATNQEITWSVIAEKTTAKDAAITDGNKLTAKGAGKVAVKAMIENGKKGETVPAMLPFEAEFEITVAALPFIPSTPSAPVTETKTEEKKTEETKTEETKTEEKKTEEKKVTVTKTVYTEKAITSALKSVPNKVKTEVKFNTKTKSTTITWDKVKGATGYLVYVKDSSNKFKQVKVIKKGKSLKLTQKELKNGKKVCIVAYQTVDGKKVAIGKSKLINIK